jgi:hypothetical protein
MPQSQQLSPLDDLTRRIDAVAKTKARLEQEIHSIVAQGKVAPASCWIVRYQAKGRTDNYWYYKLQASSPIFPTKTDGKLSRYQHLGKAGSPAYLDAQQALESAFVADVGAVIAWFEWARQRRIVIAMSG